MAQRAIVIGGSIGGLFCAAMLRKMGWEVDIFERSPVELSGRGAGIVTHPALHEALEECGAGTKDLGVRVETRTGYDISGNTIRKLDFPQIVTSWDRLHALTRATIPYDNHHLGHTFERYVQSERDVAAHFTNGRVEVADLLVGADGFRSAVRQQMHPQVHPEYAGYVVWRGLALESALPVDIQETTFETFGFFLPDRNEIIGYPIAGANNDLSPGNRRYNWVWYRLVARDDLTDMLTDETVKALTWTMLPPLSRRDIIQKLRDDAEEQLNPQFRRILHKVDAPFFTPIYDHASPSMFEGRVALTGDAAFVARPHVGMGVTKAAEDAVALANHLPAATSITEGLTHFNNSRHPAGYHAYQRGRYLGEFMTARPEEGAQRLEWAKKHNIDTIMRETAIASF